MSDTSDKKEAKKKRYAQEADTSLVFFEQEPEFLLTDWEDKNSASRLTTGYLPKVKSSFQLCSPEKVLRGLRRLASELGAGRYIC